MAETINCNFGRTAVRAIAQNLYVQNGCVKTFPPKAMAQLMQEYQSIFKDTPSMQLSTTTSTVIKLLATFNSHWHLQEKKNDFMKTFSIAEWKKLTPVQQAGHTIKQCHTCQTKYQLLTSAFPHKQTSEKKTTITFTSDDLTSPASIGRAVISQLDPIAHQHTGQSAEQVLSTTSKLMVRPTRSEQQLQTKSIVNKVKKVMQSEMDKQTATTVMGNRISWKVYNKMRTTPLIDKNTTRKRKSETNTDDLPPPKKRTHTGNIGDMMDVPRLLEEARAWPADQVINWSEVARRYGVTKPNGGQYVKEVLAKFGIIAATQNHRPQRKPRRARKVLLPGIPFPMERSIKYHKQKIAEQVKDGKILQGEKVVETTYTKLIISKESIIEEECCSFSAQKIKLIDIRKKLIQKHEELGLVRNQPDCYYDSLPHNDIQTKLLQLGVSTSNLSEPDMRMQLKLLSRQRHLKVWHDHSTIGGHSHILVTVACLYDPLFYLTPSEAGKDVQHIVERPEIHILGRSGASLNDQTLFNQCRLDCIKELSIPILTSTGNPITDILRFFYGDGPAQQYEAGNSIGGIYPCVRCAVDTDTIVNLECAFKCQTMTLQERQRFVLEGTAWKKGGMNIYDKLKKAELTEELQVRQINTRGMNKKQMDETLRSIRAGITNLPALLQCCPTADLNTLQLGRYEVCPVEPLHDLKGHFANILEESEKLLSENALAELQKVKIAILSKSTLRCSDYRKAIILLYIKFRDNKFDKEYEELFRTAAELSHLLYSQDEKRVPKSILALHNISFLHGMICVQLFRDTAPPRMFGRYFHALISHSPLFFRLASMSALNTEDEERIFGQAKSITKSTSNYHVEQVIDNIITRVQVENALLHGTNNVDKEENSIRKLSKVAGNRYNTIIGYSMIEKYGPQFQAHLERISDFLLPGEGYWWRYIPSGIEFMDGHAEPEYQQQGPMLMHFRSTSMPDVEMYLQQQWEACVFNNTVLPLHNISHYASTDEPEAVSDASVHTSQSTENPNVISTLPYSTTETDTSSNHILVQPQQSTEVQNPERKYKTTLVKALEQLVPHSTALNEFDTLRHMLKTTQPSKTDRVKMIAKYEKLHSYFKQKLKLVIQDEDTQTDLKRIASTLLEREWRCSAVNTTV